MSAELTYGKTDRSLLYIMHYQTFKPAVYSCGANKFCCGMPACMQAITTGHTVMFFSHSMCSRKEKYVIMTKVIARVHLVHLMNADWEPGGHQPSDQANRLGLWVRRKLAATIDIYHRHTQPTRWYSFYHPAEGGRLTRRKHYSKGVQLLPKAVYRSGYRDRHNCPLLIRTRVPSNYSQTQ